MGITGLIPFLKNSSQTVNISAFSGCTVAIDAYCWLHKGAFSCADKLVKGEPTNGFVIYCVKRVNLLLSFGIKPILVFDGQCLPSKSETETKRRENREIYRKKAKLFLQEGKFREARECFQRCVDVTPEMAHQVYMACKEMGVDCIVAPYEADAQLAYLNLCGIADIVITEDSDLILFGCEKVFFKMDSEGGGLLIEKNNLNQSLGCKGGNFTFEKFRYSCILSGCDYLASLPGIGLVKAVKFFSHITNPDITFVLSKIPIYLKMPQLADKVTSEYKASFIRANNTFLYQLIFCPLNRKLLPLNPYPKDMYPDSLEYAGKYFSDEIAFGISTGHLNYYTKKPFNSSFSSFGENQSYKAVKSKKYPSIWAPNFHPRSTIPIKDKPIDTSTAGKVLVADFGFVQPKKKTMEKWSPMLASKDTPPELAEEDVLLNLYKQQNEDSSGRLSEKKRILDEKNESGDAVRALSPSDRALMDLYSTSPGKTPCKRPKIDSSGDSTREMTESLPTQLESVGIATDSITPVRNKFGIKVKSTEKLFVSSRFFNKTSNGLTPSSHCPSLLDQLERECRKDADGKTNAIEDKMLLIPTIQEPELERKLSDNSAKENTFTKLKQFTWTTKTETKTSGLTLFSSIATRRSFKPILLQKSDVGNCSSSSTESDNVKCLPEEPVPPEIHVISDDDEVVDSKPVVKTPSSFASVNKTCRVSGLSKKRPKNSKLSGLSTGVTGQLSIKEVLDNYRYKKS